MLSSFYVSLFSVIDQAVQVPLFSVTKVPTLLVLSVSIPAENIRLLLSDNAVNLEFQPSTALLVLCQCLFIFHISIVLHQLLDIAIEK